MTDAPYTVRDLREADFPYCVQSWLKTFWDSPSVSSMPSRQFYNVFHDVVESLLRSPDNRVVVLCPPPPDDGFLVLAFGVFGMVDDVPVVHYVHVRGGERGQGHFTALMELAGLREDSVFAYTFPTRDALRLNRNKYTHAVLRTDLQMAGMKKRLEKTP